MTGTGGLAPDGDYNIEFKFYDTASTGGTGQGICSGNCKWVETRTGVNKVRVANGYVTVNLGSVTAFASTINWDQDLWITMNVGGTGTPSWDGEMTPRLKLTAVPFALRAGALAGGTGANTTVLDAGTPSGNNLLHLPAESGTLCVQGASSCGFVAGTAANFIQNSTSAQTANFNVRSNAANSVTGVLQGANGQTANLFNVQTWNGSTATTVFSIGNTGNLTVQGTSALNANTTITGTAADALTVKSSANGSGIVVLNIQQNNNTSVLRVTDTGTLAVGNASNVAGVVAIGNGAGGFYGSIKSTNLTAPQDLELPNASGTFCISTGNCGTTTGTLQKAYDYSASGTNEIVLDGTRNAIDIQDNNTSSLGNGQNFLSMKASNLDPQGAGTMRIGFGIGGNIYMRPSSTLTSSVNPVLDIRNNVGNRIFTVDQTNNRVGIALGGTSTLPGYTLDVNGTLNVGGVTTLGSSLDVATTLAVGTNDAFQVSAAGVVTLAGGQTSDITTASAATATGLVVQPGLSTGASSNGAAVTISGGNGSGTTSVTGGNLTLQGGNATGASGTRNGGSVSIDAGTGASANGNITIGGTNAAGVTVGRVAGTTTLNGAVRVSTLSAVSSNSAAVCRDTATTTLTSCDATNLTGRPFLQGGNAFGTTGLIGTTDANNIQIITGTGGVVRATFDQSNSLYLGNGVTAGSPNDFVISGTGSSTTGIAGGSITLQGGNATVGNANGGNLTLTGGSGIGTGVRGLVVVNTPTFATASTQNCGVNCTITQANVDNNGAVVVNATAAGLTITLPDPTLLMAGRIVYVTAALGSSDFTLSVNGGGTGNQIAMRQNTTATMIWNGSDWTAAGASSSTTLQSAYDSTLTSAGGAEIVLNNTASSNGLTIRNNAANPLVGGILEVQSSIGTNLFSVNNNISELVANGGAEDSSTFATNWTALGGSTITRNTTSGQFATGTAGVSVAAGTAAGNGVRQNLATNPATNTSYLISFTAQLASGSPAFTDLRVDYTPTGAASGTQCAANQTIISGGWTKITCEFVTPATAVTNPDILIYQAGAAGSARTFYIDNVSMTLADDAGGIPNNVQIGGGIYGGAPTLFTLDRSSAPPVANGNTTYLGSMYYDTTSGRIQCYEADGWGACGSAPNNIISLTPEYSGAVLNGTGIGTLSADFCANSAALTVGSLCASGVSRNFYKWTSPQATEQTYSIYVSYKLPSTFKAFDSANTMTLTWLTDSANGTNGKVTYQVYRSTGSAITSCDGTNESTVATPSANTWYTTAFNGDETACGFSGGDNIIFKINVKARNNANVYVENLNFTYTNT